MRSYRSQQVDRPAAEHENKASIEDVIGIDASMP